MQSPQISTSDSCVAEQDLRSYLAGWVDDSTEARIESHLAECRRCEETVANLESEEVTIARWLQGQEIPKGCAELPPPSAEAIRAIERAKAISLPAANEDRPIEPQLPQQVAGYELLRPLGQGGMGAVYLARHRSLGKLVALKMIRANSHVALVEIERFKREIRAAGGLSHSAIINATDAGEHEGMHFLVMEYVEGLDLSQLARAVGQMSVADACELMSVVAAGLAHAHAAGIVHRDIKPSNVMLGQGGCVKILDFGLAQIGKWNEAAIEQTTVGQLMGTLDYMAPEQAENPAAVDYRADLYALGATLFRLLAGRPPLAATPYLSPLAKLRLLASATAPRLDTVREDIPAELVELVARLLSRHPEDRPASASHAAETLRLFTSESDLPRLLEQAQTIIRQQPAFDAAVDRIDAKPPTALPLAAEGNPVAEKQRPRWLWPVATMTISLLAFIAAGFFIKLELEKGELIIESDTAEVAVRVLQEGELAGEFQLETGPNRVRLREGKYEVEIKEGADTVNVENGVFSLSKGGIVIARVTRKSTPAKAPSADANKQLSDELKQLVMEYTQASATLSDNHPKVVNLRQRLMVLAELEGGLDLKEIGIPGSPKKEPNPVYDGKSLSEWLEIFTEERNSAKIEEAGQAIEALVSPSTKKLITQQLLFLGPSYSYLADSNPELLSSIDGWMKRILTATRTSAYLDEVLNVLQTSDDLVWKKRIVKTLLRYEDFIDDDLFAWAENTIRSQAKQGDEELRSEVALQLFLLAVKAPSPDSPGALKARAFVLSEENFPRKILFNYQHLFPEYDLALVTKMKVSIENCLADESASNEEVALACLAIEAFCTGAEELARVKDIEEMGAKVRELANTPVFIEAMKKRLAAFEGTTEWDRYFVATPRLLAQLQVPKVNFALAKRETLTEKEKQLERLRRGNRPPLQWNIKDDSCHLVLELLDVIDVLGIVESMEIPLKVLRSELEDAYIEVQAATEGWDEMQITWPTLGVSFASRGRVPSQNIAVNKLAMDGIIALRLDALLAEPEVQTTEEGSES